CARYDYEGAMDYW
nr:immunoglobulin heavy chain junction region [Mus musculus]NSM04162.1 immunoglobulin heavy chain junction region [Mus musculus]NSM04454.1 immunoglobulin heavy chain junction region [Mus musculus]NSM06861.1 immunoglobulin heavy chain junction region [Mus musculus]NSM07085.1 immunoglobulin heavy chain junction region [Mus musculus]